MELKFPTAGNPWPGHHQIAHPLGACSSQRNSLQCKMRKIFGLNRNTGDYLENPQDSSDFLEDYHRRSQKPANVSLDVGSSRGNNVRPPGDQKSDEEASTEPLISKPIRSFKPRNQLPSYPAMFNEEEDDNQESWARKRLGWGLKKSACVTFLILGIAIVFSIFLVIYVSAVFGKRLRDTDPVAIKGTNGAVATEHRQCSDIGVDILKNGGNAVDAAIASALCVGTLDSFSSGIGGGGFMLVHGKHPKTGNKTSVVIDFRETAPKMANQSMYKGHPELSEFGGLSVAIPGEIRGFAKAHQLFGKLPWATLFEPSIKLSRDGFIASKVLEERIIVDLKYLKDNQNFRRVFAPKGRFVRAGERVLRPKYADTLEKVAMEGPDAFYNGEIAENIVNEVQKSGGILTLDDMSKYEALVREPLVGWYKGKKVITTPAPTSGPIMMLILNIIEGFDEENIAKVEDFYCAETSDCKLSSGSWKSPFSAQPDSFPESSLKLHHWIESMKHAYAARTELGDPSFVNISSFIEQIVDKQHASALRQNVSDSQTFPIKHYNPKFEPVESPGTTHLSVIDSDDLAVSLMSTVNLNFGSKVLSSETGVILNDEMDDFSVANKTNYFGLKPSKNNFVRPGARPLSSCVPTVIEQDNGRGLLVAGASGGSKIITSTLQVILDVIDGGWELGKAVSRPRVHHQLFPDKVRVEYGYPKNLVLGLEQRGHKIDHLPRDWWLAAVQAVQKSEVNTPSQSSLKNGQKNSTSRILYAASDPRKNGVAAAY